MEVLFWISVFLIFHTYILYPSILRIIAIYKKPNRLVYLQAEELPFVSLVMSVYNEEKVIRQKLESIVQSNYPQNHLEFLIGSDNSSDRTNEIIREFAIKHNNIKLNIFAERQGKANIINQLAKEATGEILILTDANVIFTTGTIYQLVKHYKNASIDIVGGNIINTNIKNSGISFQEKTYLVNENYLKYCEGIIWGSMMGAFGGCYAVRKSKYAPVPRNYFMDDFYITMSALSSGGKAINELDAICYEDVSNIIYEEFRRKIRISIGNYQNLNSFKKMLWPPYKGLGFAFLSHKVLRWITPFLLISAYVFNLLIIRISSLYGILFILQTILFVCPLLDLFLRKLNFNSLLLRFITHFYAMNFSLLIGLFIYIKGVKTNVWQPTKRYQ